MKDSFENAPKSLQITIVFNNDCRIVPASCLFKWKIVSIDSSSISILVDCGVVPASY